MNHAAQPSSRIRRRSSFAQAAGSGRRRTAAVESPPLSAHIACNPSLSAAASGHRLRVRQGKSSQGLA